MTLYARSFECFFAQNNSNLNQNIIRSETNLITSVVRLLVYIQLERIQYDIIVS